MTAKPSPVAPSRIAQKLPLAVLVALFLLLAGGGGSASAVISGHVFDFEFGVPEGSEPGHFGFSYAGVNIAVDSTTGDIYATDPGNARVQKFDDEGNFLMTWGFGVKDGSNEFQVCQAPEPCQAGIPGFAPGQFVLPAGIAVDDSNGPNKGRVYVIEVSGWYGQGRNEVLKYSPNGTPEGGFNGAASPLGAFTEPAPAKLDVDGEGYVWVADREWPQGSRVMRFSNQPSNAYIGGSEWEMRYDTGGGQLEPGPAFNLAPTPSGDAAYISTWYQGNCCGLYRVVANGSAQRLVFPTGGGQTVFDPTNGHFFVAGMDGFVPSSPVAQEFDGDPVDPQPVGPPTVWPGGGGGSLAFNSTTSTLYAIAQYQGPIAAFKPRRVPETLTTPASEVLHTTATLNGQTAPDPIDGGDVSECYFQWGLTTTYEHEAPCEPGTPIANPTAVSADLTGLQQEGTIHYRLVAANTVGKEFGEDRTFTPHAVLGLGTDEASAITSHDATLNGIFETDGEQTEYQFEWGRKAVNLNQVTPLTGVPGTAGATTVSADIDGLEDYTEYAFRITATNSLGTSYGPILTFRTKAADAPEVSGLDVEDVTGDSAHLRAAVTPNFGETMYGFEYGETMAYGSQRLASDILAADAQSHPVGMDIDGLEPGKTYHYRAVAINFGGITYSSDKAFSTRDVPKILSESASAVTGSGARLNALVHPSSSPTTVRFEYGPGPAYGASTGSVSIGAGDAPVSAGVDVSGLTGQTIYHFRTVATNSVGTQVGPDQTFSTSAIATPPPPRTSCKSGFVRKGGKCVRRPCRDGFVRRNGKCVRKQKQRQKRHRKATSGDHRSAR